MSFDIRENLKKLPDSPGVYMHKDDTGRIIYVGKAINLKRRVSQYFRPPNQLDPKTRAMVSHICSFEYIRVGTEMEALILENNLIKKYKPQYNIDLRDDKTYPYLKVTLKDEWPRLLKTRRVDPDGARYFGPYTDVGSVNQIIDYLNDTYSLKRCNTVSFPEGFRPCLYYHMGQCRGMCVRAADKEQYAKDIAEVVSVLDGKNKNLLKRLQANMKEASEKMLFEEAAHYRDRINAVEAIAEKQRITLRGPSEMDIVLTTESATRRYGIVFFVRNGKLSGRDSFPLGKDVPGEGAELTAAFLKQYYTDSVSIPKEILTDGELPERELLEEWLSNLRGSRVSVAYPKRGEKRALLGLARRDVVQMLSYLDEKAANDEEKARGCNHLLQKVLDEGAAGAVPDADGVLPEVPVLPESNVRIESYDISHLAGTDTVGGMVVFRDGKPLKKDYRKFRVRTETAGDDEGALKEVLDRRMRRYLSGDPGFSPLPDLLLIDGGAGQVSAVKETLQSLGLSAIPVLGMAKDDHHRTRALLYEGTEFPLESEPVLFRFIGLIQEEVHRFSIEYQRSLRGKNMTRSLLEEIPGIGEKRRNALLLKFGTVENLREAIRESEESARKAIAETPGMNEGAAESVIAFFREHPNR